MPGDDPSELINVTKDGHTVPVRRDQLAGYVDQGFAPESREQGLDRAHADVMRREYGGSGGAVVGGVLGLARGATLGASDVALDALGAGDAAREIREQHPYISTATEIGGSLIDGGPAGLAAKVGKGIAEGGGIARAIAGHATTGALFGAGTGVSELALSSDPVTWDRATSVLSSNMLFGGAVGGAVGGLGKVAEKGLSRAQEAIEAARAGSDLGSEAPADLAGLDRKGLRAAHDAEIQNIKAGRVPEQQSIGEDLASYRQDLKETKKIWLATKDVPEPAGKAPDAIKLNEIGKISYEADKSIDRLLRNPKMLAERPGRALEALQQQENALEHLAKREPELRAVFSADDTPARQASLDAIPDALEQNRALQQRIRTVTSEPASERLSAIRDLQAAGPAAKAEPSMIEQMLGGSIFGKVSHVVASHVPVIGPFLGAKAAKLATDLVFGRMANASAEAAARTAKAVEAFVNVANKSTGVAPVIATKILSRVAYAPKQARASEPDAGTASSKAALAELFKKRTAEIKSQTAYDPTGVPRMRPEARQAMAARLGPIRAVSPIAADRMETIAARRMEYLSSKIPRRPDLGMPIGPDRWQPSDMEMRGFARHVAAVEDPGGVEERVAAGTVTPEDAEAYHSVYPERAADFKRQLLERLPELQKSLPYNKRVALSIFTGAPVDPAMHPQILRVLQGQFDEPGSEGGTQAPTANPQFGSVKKSLDAPTPGQARSGGS